MNMFLLSPVCFPHTMTETVKQFQLTYGLLFDRPRHTEVRVPKINQLLLLLHFDKIPN